MSKKYIISILVITAVATMIVAAYDFYLEKSNNNKTSPTEEVLKEGVGINLSEKEFVIESVPFDNAGLNIQKESNENDKDEEKKFLNPIDQNMDNISKINTIKPSANVLQENIFKVQEVKKVKRSCAVPRVTTQLHQDLYDYCSNVMSLSISNLETELKNLEITSNKATQNITGYYKSINEGSVQQQFDNGMYRNANQPSNSVLINNSILGVQVAENSLETSRIRSAIQSKIFDYNLEKSKCYERATAYYFDGYLCKDDCSGHVAGYEWAKENNIEDDYVCDSVRGNKKSFVEGCNIYIDNCI